MRRSTAGPTPRASPPRLELRGAGLARLATVQAGRPAPVTQTWLDTRSLLALDLGGPGQAQRRELGLRAAAVALVDPAAVFAAAGDALLAALLRSGTDGLARHVLARGLAHADGEVGQRHLAPAEGGLQLKAKTTTEGNAAAGGEAVASASTT